MTVPDPLIGALVAIFAVLLAGVLADVGIWRRSLSRDLKHLTERLAVVETSIRYLAPSAHRRAQREVQDDLDNHH